MICYILKHYNHHNKVNNRMGKGRLCLVDKKDFELNPQHQRGLEHRRELSQLVKEMMGMTKETMSIVEEVKNSRCSWVSLLRFQRLAFYINIH